MSAVKTALLYPPFMDPRAPQLALPSLAAFLRQHSVEVSLHDLALETVLWMVQSSTLARSRDRLARTQGSPAAGRLRAFEHAAELVPWAVRQLRSPEAFFDPRDFLAAREVLGGVIRGHCAANGDRVVASIEPISYSVRGCDASRLSDLLEATSDAERDLFADFYREVLIPRLRAEAPAAVGISLTNGQQWVPGLHLARRLKAEGFFVVLGGALISKFTGSLSEAFFGSFADAVIAYEGETAMLELLGRLEGNRDFTSVPNLVYWDGSRVRANSTRFENVNSLPTPDFDGLPLGEYLTPEPVLPILTGKGCYFNRCRFCDIPFINHVSPKPYRLRHPTLVVDDVRALGSKYGARHFVITDEALSPKLLLKLADAFKPYAHEDRNFTGYARLEEGFTRAVFDEIARMGVRKLFFGMESASQEMIDHMDKATVAQETPRILRQCRDAGIRFHVFSIIGLPEESEAQARQTYRFFLDNRRILDTPGNTFGIKPFSLELRTSYFDDRERYGVEVEESALEAEFLVGIEPTGWRNTRGLSHENVQRLLRREFQPGLVANFRRMYGNNYAVWPISEEYSVLYCRRYGGADYPFQACLPARDSSLKFTLRLNPAWPTRTDGLALHIETPHQEVSLPRVAIDIATRNAARSVQQVLDELNEPDEQGVWSLLDQLVRGGLLQLKTEPLRADRLSSVREKQLLRVLCLQEAERLGIAPTADEVARFTTQWRREHAVADSEEHARWLETRGLTGSEFERIMREYCTVELVEQLYRSESRDGTVECSKVFGVP